MRIAQIKIENYKSLKRVSIAPHDLSLLIGANASGKSNFCDCLQFISETYMHGLDLAISRKGGFENIAHRRVRRTKLPVNLTTTVILGEEDFVRGIYLPDMGAQAESLRATLQFKITHSFSFKAKSDVIRAEYAITEEEIKVEFSDDGLYWTDLLNATRSDSRVHFNLSSFLRESLQSSLVIETIDLKTLIRYIFGSDIALKIAEQSDVPLDSRELLISERGRFFPILRLVTNQLSDIKVYQLSPTVCRQYAAPIPQPELGRNGQDLPAVLLDIKQHAHDTAWQDIIESLQGVIPELEDIDVRNTTSRTLTIMFKEANMGRPWAVEEISDGTIQFLALLVAISDPKSSMVVIEEPENSVHPWIIRNFISTCQKFASNKQIILTTHSPIVIDLISPADTFAVWRENGETAIKTIGELDTTMLDKWRSGAISSFSYFDSGKIPQVVPPAPQLPLEIGEDCQ